MHVYCPYILQQSVVAPRQYPIAIDVRSSILHKTYKGNKPMKTMANFELVLSTCLYLIGQYI